jgi:hypothetical protein
LVYRSKQFNMKVMIIINDAPYGSGNAYNALRLALQTRKYHEVALATGHGEPPGFDILKSARNGVVPGSGYITLTAF